MASPQINATRQVVKEAMRVVSKEVRAPKVVRDGTIKAIKKNNKSKTNSYSM